MLKQVRWTVLLVAAAGLFASGCTASGGHADEHAEQRTDPTADGSATDETGREVCAELVREDGVVAVYGDHVPSGDDEWARWGGEVFALGEQATRSSALRDEGEAILVAMPDMRFTPKELIPLTWELAVACVAAGYISQDQSRSAFQLG